MALFDPSMFNPQSYGGYGGLLSNALNFPQPTPTSGFSQPDASAIPAAAQPAGPAQPQSIPLIPSFVSDAIGSILGGNKSPFNTGGLLTGGGINGGLQSIFQAVVPQVANAQYQRQIMGAQLQSLAQMPDMTLAKAMAIMQNPKLQEQVFGNPISLGEAKIGPNLSVPVVAQNGNTRYALPGGVPAGAAPVAGVPGGASPGTGIPPASAAPAGGIAQLAQLGNELSRQASASAALGKAQGTAQASLPNALAQADQAINLIDSIKKDPSLSQVTGPVAGRLPVIFGPQADMISKIDQLKGQAFLQAWQSLKGAGARITNVESMRATDAIGRLNRLQSTAGFTKALDDLRQVISDVRTRAGTMAGGEPTPPPPAAPTQAAPSGVVDYRTYFGAH